MTNLKITQLRYYSDGNKNNSSDDINSSTLQEDCLENYKPVYRLGIQTLPGTKFYINDNSAPVIVGPSGVYEIDLSNNTSGILLKLSFEEASLERINNIPTGYLIIDIVYGGGDS